MKIEVLSCKHCRRLVISVDDTRINTRSCAEKGHGSGKCAGAWTVLVAAEYLPPILEPGTGTPTAFPDCNIGTAHECCVARMKRLEKERFGVEWSGTPPTEEALDDYLTNLLLL